MLTGIKQQLNQMQEETRKAQVDITEVVKGEIQRAMSVRGKSGTIKEVIDAEILHLTGGQSRRYLVRQSKAIPFVLNLTKPKRWLSATNQQIEATCSPHYDSKHHTQEVKGSYYRTSQKEGFFLSAPKELELGLCLKDTISLKC